MMAQLSGEQTSKVRVVDRNDDRVVKLTLLEQDVDAELLHEVVQAFIPTPDKPVHHRVVAPDHRSGESQDLVENEWAYSDGLVFGNDGRKTLIIQRQSPLDNSMLTKCRPFNLNIRAIDSAHPIMTL
jgi:hypothetical protein